MSRDNGSGDCCGWLRIVQTWCGEWAFTLNSMLQSVVAHRHRSLLLLMMSSVTSPRRNGARLWMLNYTLLPAMSRTCLTSPCWDRNTLTPTSRTAHGWPSLFWYTPTEKIPVSKWKKVHYLRRWNNFCVISEVNHELYRFVPKPRIDFQSSWSEGKSVGVWSNFIWWHL